MSQLLNRLSLGISSLILASALNAAGNPAGSAEYEAAIKLQGNIDAGRNHYKPCVVCHGPEGWGTQSGAYPQIAGQLPSVLIKQLADIRAGNRDNPIMRPFTTSRVLPDAQAIADLAAYVAQLPMTPNNGRGPGIDLVQGKALYEKECAECHGYEGEGNNSYHIPALQGQHYQYLRREFDWIRSGRRQNADPKMVEQVKYLSPREVQLIMDYASQLRPPAEKLAKDNWKNQDFPGFQRDVFQRHIGP